jgi:hypothetical protein
LSGVTTSKEDTMRQRRIGTWALSVLVAVGWLGMAGGAWGQNVEGRTDGVVAESPTPRAAGTAAEFVLALSPFAAEAGSAFSAALLRANLRQRWCEDSCVLYAPVNLSSGAMIIGVEIDAVDLENSGDVSAYLLRCPVGEALCLLLAQASTGLAATPGTTQLRTNLTAPHTVDNEANTYVIGVELSGGTMGTRLTGLRVFYRLQVSPAPAVASFGDVPTSHPFFRFVEALVASGVTAGCGGGNYCPDAPLTRGQMATFLSLALGLHFAP